MTRPAVSFEFFPPKNLEGSFRLWDCVNVLGPLEPEFVSVTYGAGGTTQDRTVRVTKRIADETSLTPLAHLTCVGASVRQVRQVVGQYASSGVRNILALRGDPPGNVRGEWTPHPEGLDHADQLVSLIRGLGDFTVGVAAFPDVHPDSPGLGHDVDVLVGKADAGASFAITQMVFDADSYLRFRDQVAARRDLPIDDVMPMTSDATTALGAADAPAPSAEASAPEDDVGGGAGEPGVVDRPAVPLGVVLDLSLALLVDGGRDRVEDEQGPVERRGGAERRQGGVRLGRRVHEGHAGDQQDRQAGANPAHVVRKVGAGATGHGMIGDHQIELRSAFRQQGRLGRRRCLDHPIAEIVEHRRDPGAHQRLVVDQQGGQAGWPGDGRRCDDGIGADGRFVRHGQQQRGRGPAVDDAAQMKLAARLERKLLDR